MVHAAFFILALPLVGFLVLWASGRRLGEPAAGWVATGAVGLAFVAAVVTWAGLLGRAGSARRVTETLFTWLPVGHLRVPVAVLVDPLSMTMALFVTGVATLIHLYSIGYMHKDPRFARFFVYLNLFVFSMLLLVLANNFVLTFVGWEGVGVCSYWLISFWFDRPTAASAGKKAFIYNRVGDVGFLLAMFLIFEKTGSLTYTKVFAAGAHGAITAAVATAATLLLFVGAIGKSAQIPFYPWLVDAMEGPTPVSALIHAATMVTAGVYLMCRVAPLLALSPVTSTVIAAVGATTAFVAAAAACAQQDIKKVLAYSTVSQLGFMFLAVGAHAYVAAIFLMVAHAFYKALLFLGAGSVIHGLHDEQDLKKMGGLRRYMPITAATFVIAWLAIGGVPPLAGFWAKGDVLLNAWARDPVLWVVAALAAVLTAYYAGRETMLAFYGPERWREAAPPPRASREAGAPHESPWMMTVPLVVLAFLAVVGGLLDLPFPHLAVLHTWLLPVFGSHLRVISLSDAPRVALATTDAVLAVVGAGGAVLLWGRGRLHPSLEPRLLFLGFGLDLGLDRGVARPSTALAGVVAEEVEPKVIDGAVRGAAGLVAAGGGLVRRVQSGYVRRYALLLATGAVFVLGFVISRAGL